MNSVVNGCQAVLVVSGPGAKSGMWVPQRLSESDHIGIEGVFSQQFRWDSIFKWLAIDKRS